MKDLNSILTSIKNRKLSPIYFLMGEESYFIDQITSLIETSVLTEEEKGFNQMTLYGKDTSIDDIVANAKRFPMMAEYQILIVKEAQNLSRTIEQLVDYVKHPQSSTILVLNYKYKTLDKRKALYKALSKVAVVFEAKKIYENKISSWMTSNLAPHHIKINPNAARMLIEFLGTDLSKINNELNKLRVVIGDSDTITPELVETHIGISKDFNNFELQNALGMLNHKKAFQIVRYFSQNPKDHPFLLTTSILFSYFSKLMIVHTLTNRDPRAVAKALGVNPFFVQDYLGASSNFSMKRISAILDILRIFDVKSKGVGANNSPKDLYNELIFRILN